MVRKNLDLSDSEKAQADLRKAELQITDREAYLLGLGIEPAKRIMGRPVKKPLQVSCERGATTTIDNESFKNKIYRS